MFESLLAKRYIFSQKRHTVLTICSIAVALALMTMLFTGFSTVVVCMRNVVCDTKGEYHVAVSVSEEQGKAIESYIGDRGICSFEIIPEGVYVRILFNEYIDDRNAFMDEMFRSVGMSDKTYYSRNSTLMMLDMIDVESRAELVQIFALFYIFVLFFVIALRLVIDTAFEVSSKERERQFGVLQSVGATPKQIVRIITYEGLFLSVVGIPIGVVLGIGLGFAAYQAVVNSGLSEVYFTPEKAAELLHFNVNPWLVLIGVVTGIVWIFLSAYGTGMRIIKMSPIQAISARSNTVKKVQKRSVFGFLFGWKGRLASRNNRRQPKRFLITVVSLTLSIALFASFSYIIDRVQLSSEIKELGNSFRFGSDFTVGYYNNTDSLEEFIETHTKMGFDPLYYRTALDVVEESGYFDNIVFGISEYGKCYNHNIEDIDHHVNVYVDYWNREQFDKQFDGKPPISYDDLTAQGGYILLIDGIWSTGEHFADRDSISFEVTKDISITADEYLALTPEEQELARPHGYYYGDTEGILYYNVREECTVTLPISCTADGISQYYSKDSITLVGTLDEYENGECWLYGNSSGGQNISMDLADDDKYHEALEFMEQRDEFALYEDNYGERRRIEVKFEAIRAGGVFLNIMIALVAAVNMINIISTGILNRRGELAAMQCVGMTERQLYGMTIVECLQYALSAAVSAVILCELIMLGTDFFLTYMTVDNLSGYDSFEAYDMVSGYGGPVSYIAVLPKALLAAAATFVIALLASVIPLRQMQKTSIVEQIQSVD